jgi:predicted DNA binding CopG/RHH family protein
MGKLKKAAAMHVKRKQSITLRINVMDLEAIKLKASRVGIPYQTYINMIIHQDATSM